MISESAVDSNWRAWRLTLKLCSFFAGFNHPTWHSDVLSVKTSHHGMQADRIVHECRQKDGARDKRTPRVRSRVARSRMIENPELRLEANTP